MVLTLRLWTKSYGVTIHVKSLRKYFHVVLFGGAICFKKFYKMKFGIFVEFALVTFGSERAKGAYTHLRCLNYGKV